VAHLLPLPAPLVPKETNKISYGPHAAAVLAAVLKFRHRIAPRFGAESVVAYRHGPAGCGRTAPLSPPGNGSTEQRCWPRRRWVRRQSRSTVRNGTADGKRSRRYGRSRGISPFGMTC